MAIMKAKKTHDTLPGDWRYRKATESKGMRRETTGVSLRVQNPKNQELQGLSTEMDVSAQEKRETSPSSAVFFYLGPQWIVWCLLPLVKTSSLLSLLIQMLIFLINPLRNDVLPAIQASLPQSSWHKITSVLPFCISSPWKHFLQLPFSGMLLLLSLRYHCLPIKGPAIAVWCPWCPSRVFLSLLPPTIPMVHEVLPRSFFFEAPN